jgi:transcriptional regulator with XRE-family HTH domain
MSGPERVATARREAGLTQKELADRMGVSLWNVERMEEGQEDALARLDALAHATGKPRSWFGFAEPPQEEVKDAGPEIDRGSVLVVCWAIIILVCIRFFSEVIPLLPRAVNFADIPVVIALALCAVLLPSLHTRLDRSQLVFLFPGLIFLTMCAFALLVNPGRVATGPALVFIYGYLAPVGVYFAVYRLWPVGAAMSLSRLLVGLTVLQLVVVATISLPRFLAQDNPDLMSGTFGTNAYQLVFFLLVTGALLAGIFTFEPERRVAKWVPLMFVAMLATIFLAQYRALILTTAATLLLIGLLLGTLKVRGLVLGLGVIAIFVGTLNFTNQLLPKLNLGPAVKAFTSNPGQIAIERLRALDHLGHLFTDHPRFMLTGTGPGTYASRAWQTFSQPDAQTKSNVAGSYVLFLTGGEVYRTDVSNKYVMPQVENPQVFQGSYALKYPYSDYSSLLAEVGFFGFAAMVFIYLAAMWRAGRMTLFLRRLQPRGDPLPALALAAATGFFVLLQMGMLQSWLEVTRLTIPTWIILAVVTKEFHARFDPDRKLT